LGIAEVEFLPGQMPFLSPINNVKTVKVKSPHDVVYQKLLNLVDFSLSYLKNRAGAFDT